jgi:hypothetical protein
METTKEKHKRYREVAEKSMQFLFDNKLITKEELSINENFLIFLNVFGIELPTSLVMDFLDKDAKPLDVNNYLREIIIRSNEKK